MGLSHTLAAAILVTGLANGSFAQATNDDAATPTNTVSQNTNHRAADPKIIDYSPAKCWSEPLGFYGFKQVCASSRVVEVEEMEFTPAPLTTAPQKNEPASGAIGVHQAYIAASAGGNFKLQKNLYKNLYIEKITCEKSASAPTTICNTDRIKIGDMPLLQP